MINGQPLITEFPIELRELTKSCQLSGAFWIVTCGCGVPDCAGIEEPIAVQQWQECITWTVPSPLSFHRLPNDPADDVVRPETVSYRFDPDRYMDSVLDGLRQAKMLVVSQVGPVKCSPRGFEPENLLALDPRLFERRMPEIDTRWLPTRVEINRAGPYLAMKGMTFALAQLPLPAEIIALAADWSEWEPLIVGTGAFYNYAAGSDPGPPFG